MNQLNPHVQYFIFGCPAWVWLSAIGIGGVFLALFAIIGIDLFGPKPVKRIVVDDTAIELWEKERKLPGGADAIIVPVATDMKMSAGIAKWVRDKTADTIQYEALKVAPLPPGDVFVGSGGKYRFNSTALAVVMDDQKRTSPEWIREAIATALVRLRAEDAETCFVPDMTDDLLQQPKTITDEQRRATCRPVAHAIMDGIISSGTHYVTIKIWAPRVNRDIWLEELDRVAEDVLAGRTSLVPA